MATPWCPLWRAKGARAPSSPCRTRPMHEYAAVGAGGGGVEVGDHRGPVRRRERHLPRRGRAAARRRPGDGAQQRDCDRHVSAYGGAVSLRMTPDTLTTVAAGTEAAHPP